MTRSTDCTEAVRHRFDNDADYPVDCFWLDYDGNEVCYATVQPGVSHLQSTFKAHPWRFKRAGTTLGEYAGPSATMTFLPGDRMRVQAGLQPRVPPEVRVEHWGVYRRRGISRRGIGVHACDCVTEEAIRETLFTIDAMLALAPETVLARMRQWGALVAVIGGEQRVTDLPEYRHLKGKPWGSRASVDDCRGLGGNLGNPTSSVGEENVLMRDDRRYGGESLLLHELAHGVMDIGFAEDPFQKEIVDCWEAARKRGTYDPSSYIISSPGEYWAEATQAWFEGTVRSDVTSGLKTRDDIKRADPWLASLLTRAYGDGPWRFWHTSPAPFSDDEQRWNEARTQGWDQAARQAFGWPPAGGSAAVNSQPNSQEPVMGMPATCPPGAAFTATQAENFSNPPPPNVVYRPPQQQESFDLISMFMRPVERFLDKI